MPTHSFIKEIEKLREAVAAIGKGATMGFQGYKTLGIQLLEENQKLLKSFERAAEGLNVFKDNPEYFVKIAHNGWFLNLNVPFAVLISLADKLKIDDYDSVNDILKEYYGDDLELFTKMLIRRHPNRAEIFHQILSAHEKGLFALTVPTLICQVDGITLDHAKTKFFAKNKTNDYKLVITEVLEKKYALFDSFLSPLYEDTPIMVQYSSLTNYPSNLNRHAVLHGQDYLYYSEENSLKCYSLLIFISDVLRTYFVEG